MSPILILKAFVKPRISEPLQERVFDTEKGVEQVPSVIWEFPKIGGP